MKELRYFSIALLLLVFSCKKDGSSPSKPLVDFSYNDETDRFVLKSNATDAGGEPLKYRWYSMTDSIQIIGTQASSAYISLPIISEPRPLKVKLVVSNGSVKDSVTKEIMLPKNTYFRTYGLGKELKKERSINLNYSWYLDQYNTGAYSSDNCGPTTTTMALKWINQNFDRTPEQARAVYKPTGGWWNTSDIIKYLNQYNVNNKTIGMTDINTIQSHIDAGNIIILCLDTHYIRTESNTNWHIDRFHNPSAVGSGHFIIVKGYRVVDEQVYYEVYDSNSWNKKYPDGRLKGIDRYYRAEDLSNAVVNWWKYFIVVSKGSLNAVQGVVDINKISHKHGS